MDVFECEPTRPERDLSGDWIDKMTGIPDVRIKGIHLKLPGYENGPTLEIFEYNKISKTTKDGLINDPGFSHIAFHVSNGVEWSFFPKPQTTHFIPFFTSPIIHTIFTFSGHKDVIGNSGRTEKLIKA